MNPTSKQITVGPRSPHPHPVPLSLREADGPERVARDAGSWPTVICFEVGFMVRLRGVTHGGEEEGQ